MPFAQQLGDLFLGGLHAVFRADGGVDDVDDIIAADGAPAKEAVGRGREGHEYGLIEVGAADAGAALLHHSNDAEEDIVDANRLVEGVLVGFEERAEDIGAEHDDAAALLDVGLADEGADGGVAQEGILVGGGDAADGYLHVAAAPGDDDAAGDLGRDREDVGHAQGIGNGVTVAQGEDAYVAPPFLGRPAAELTGKDVEQVGAEAGKLLDEEPLHAAPDAQEGDHGANADDDAEHGQAGTEFVGREGQHGDANGFVEVHGG